MSTPSGPSPFEDFGAYLSNVTEALDKVTTPAAALPGRSDLSFHRTLDRKLANELDEASTRVLKLAESLLSLVELKTANKGKARRKLEDEDDVIDGYRRGVVGHVDGLLEDADSCLDDLNGQKRKAAIEIRPSLQASAGKKLPGPFQAQSSIPSTFSESSYKMPPPQASFPDAVDNSRARPPFQPTLPYKHHAMVPLDHQSALDYRIDPDPSKAVQQLQAAKARAHHPYDYETRHLQYPTSLFSVEEPTVPEPLDMTPPEWVDTPEALATMVEELKEATEIAVDLEHHNHHSYHGFTCLMQVSTRNKDWLVDTLKLRGALREEKLGGVLADPAVVKVFHGADSDIVWLQKDFDIYVVNLFDTYHATKCLGFPSHSLASLLAKYCHFEADKRYQLADWRVRPLTSDMARYAQSDTHFLLYIFDHLRNALLEQSRSPSPDPEAEQIIPPGPDSNPQRSMRMVLNRSADTALKLYERVTYDVENGGGSHGWLTQAKKHLPGGLSAFAEARGHIWKKAHIWRDDVARKLDKSPYLIMTNDVLRSLTIAGRLTEQSLKAKIRDRSMEASTWVGEILQVVDNAKQEWETRSKAIEVTADKAADPVERFQTPAVGPISIPKGTAGIPIDGLWATAPASDIIDPSRINSTLFGTTLSKSSKRTTQVALPAKVKSSLFGGTLQNGQPETNGSPSTFDDVAKGIFEELRGPAVTNGQEEIVGPNLDTQAAGEQTASQSGSQLPAPETVPFVPSGFRETITVESAAPATKKSSKSEAKKAMIADDTDEVVKVGKNKKAKKVKSVDPAVSETAAETTPSEELIDAAAAQPSVTKSKLSKPAGKKSKIASVADGSSSAASTPPSIPTKRKKGAVVPSDIPEFSYENTPNLLDNPVSAPTKLKKPKKNKGGKSGPIGATFGKIPQDQSQPKAGNKSGTFT